MVFYGCGWFVKLRRLEVLKFMLGSMLAIIIIIELIIFNSECKCLMLKRRKCRFAMQNVSDFSIFNYIIKNNYNNYYNKNRM